MYMARGPIAAARLTRDDDGNLRYQLKKAFRDGTTHILLSPVELLEKIAALIAPPWQNQIHYNGVFAHAAGWRDAVVSPQCRVRSVQAPSIRQYLHSTKNSLLMMDRPASELKSDRPCKPLYAIALD